MFSHTIKHISFTDLGPRHKKLQNKQLQNEHEAAILFASQYTVNFPWAIMYHCDKCSARGIINVGALKWQREHEEEEKAGGKKIIGKRNTGG